MASYSDAELQEIARWLKDGLSASRIAAAFSALRGSPVSRNAIIGVVHRNAMLGAIGFAHGRGMPPVARQAAGERAMRKPSAAKQAKDKANGKAAAENRAGVHAADSTVLRKNKVRPRHDSSPAWLPPRLFVREVGVLIADGEAYRFKVPAPPRGPIGRQPHGVAMRFIDCLFSRCRAPLDLTVGEDAENDAPGGRPGADMLCCGMRTRALKSYCSYHQARFQRRVLE
ncbi:GcrA family cell cycle regulator [Mesorhizobium sp. NZP2077]|uniref:GcrA family cell cycle regulator n=1 Tax=Mesorhizobium sp. NZP2077 TaxID=2483404 RepID=UPI0015544AD3|nr:GcrA family cell cycle regulator [Mesorhizobium sp. NZP2077]QKC82681.1 GcrA cell cycle regulator [Mesorhizobium sp. NZP2077]QKD16181.1 GcrA cell cycle regulator [Mesorhizobium sp. NZP2077]